MSISEESTVLSSWKDIARYLGKGVRTVQRWERHLGLPVRRPTGASQKSAVLLHRGEVDAWLATRFSARTIEKSKVQQVGEPLIAERARLKEGIQTARQLRETHQTLTQQISESIRLLTERCDHLTTQSLQAPWHPSATEVPALLPNPGTVAPRRILDTLAG
jgi:hypothetical protein